MMDIFAFFDAGFLRLLFTLLVDYLISAGFLLPEQRQQWVDGWGHVIGIAGGVLFLAIWQYHSHKKENLKVTQKTIETVKVQTPEITLATPNVKDFI